MIEAFPLRLGLAVVVMLPKYYMVLVIFDGFACVGDNGMCVRYNMMS